MKLTPRWYQQEAHDMTMSWVKKCFDPCLIEAPTGAGKSIIVAMLAHTLHKASGKKILCLAPSKELVQQNREKYLLTGEPASMFSASAGAKETKHAVVFGSPLTVANNLSKFGANYSAVIVDECFPGETMVSTPCGEKRIDSISVGDVVHCAGGCGIVRSVFTKSSSTITVRTKHGNSFRCTPDHPVFTEKGFVKASELENGTRIFCREEVSMLFKSVQAENDDIKEWERSICRIGISVEQARVLLSILLEEMEEPNAQQRKQREDEVVFAENWSRSGHKGWKWEAAKSSAALLVARAWEWMGNGVANKNSCRSPKWRLSELLQGGYRERKEKNSNRSGWIKPFIGRSLVSRLQKRREAEGAWMDCVSHIERGCHEAVYNLRVGGHPSYFANGVLVHNCHGLTPTLISIIDHMRSENPKLRIIGLSATPYRLGTGYIYANHYANGAVSEEQAIDPFFSMLVYSIDARMLIAEGFLSQPVFKTTEECYDTSGLTLNRMGQFDAATVDRAFVGQGRKTSVIVNDIIERSRDKQGVMIFAATIQHANEIMDSLPKELSAIVTGKNTKQEREQAISDFKAKRVKYLVNVAVLTTGFDASHVDHVAIMRATESVGLLQQIIGRGLRVEPGKTECLISDYAENIERHCPDGDVFSPEIKARRKLESTPISVCCPSCGYENEFARRPNPDEFEIDSEGYFIDLAGARILADEDKPLPAHYGRRCKGWSIVAGRMEQCAHKWSFKLCECGAENDIAARYCTTCRGEIIDPNTRLKIEAIKIANDPYRIRTADVQMWNISRHKGKDGKPDSVMVEYMIECSPSSLREWYHPESDSAWLLSKWNKFCLAVFGEQGLTIEQAIERRYDALQPSKVMYQKKKNSKYFEVVGFKFFPPWNKRS